MFCGILFKIKVTPSNYLFSFYAKKNATVENEIYINQQIMLKP